MRNGRLNGVWKGDDVSYDGLHKWLRMNKPLPDPPICEECKMEKKLEISNITGIYNRDFSNYKWLCRSCYITIDMNRYWKERREREIAKSIVKLNLG
jgi:NifB/MoaA-like Fe-S oxidoreductase